MDDRYYERLDLEDEELGFYEHSALLPRASQTLPGQLLGSSREEEQNTCDDGLDHNGSGRKPITTGRRLKLSPTQIRTLETAFRCNPRIGVDAQAQLAED